MKKIAVYLIPVLICFGVGALAGYVQAPSIEEWYPGLVKPALTPPNYVFPIAWSIIYLCMGLSLGVLLDKGHSQLMLPWGLQLAVNFLWSILFFWKQSPLAGLVDIAVLVALVIWYIVAAARLNRTAAWLFAPYLVWILFATYLNAYIWYANPQM